MLDIFRPDYRAHSAFVAPARAAPDLWRLVLGVVLVLATFLFLSQMLWSLVLSALSPLDQDVFLDNVFVGASPGSVLFVLAQLALLIPAVSFAVLALHKRQPETLWGPMRQTASQFGWVLLAQVILMVVLVALPPYSLGGAAPAAHVPLARWLVLLPLALVCIFFQCAAEEIAFRGYLQQQLAARFAHPLIWMGLPSALFAFGHYLPEDAGSNAVPIALLSGLFGLAMADLTARAGTLGPAMAVHFANNVFAILLFAPVDNMPGLALYTLPFGLADEAFMRSMLPVDLAGTCVAWLAARLVLRR